MNNNGPNTPEATTKPAETDEAIFLEAMARLKIAEDAESENRVQGIEALAFENGEQWDADIGNQRKIDGRPALTINHTATFCARQTNTLRQQRPRIKCHPVGNGADVDTAATVNGLIRHIETISNASVAYDTGVTSAVKIGWGYWRILSEYIDEMSFDQELKICPIRNTFTVYMDPSAVMPAGEDQMWNIISEKMKRAEYKRRYPRAKNAEWQTDAPGDMTLDWENKEEIRLAEYFRIREVRDTLCMMSDGSAQLKSAIATPELLAAVGLTQAVGKDGKPIERPTTRRQVEWFRLNGSKVVDRKVLPGRFIPVIRCEGNVLDLNGKVSRKGMIKNLMDPQRMFNYAEPLALDTPIPTPSGWTTMGDIRIGAHVYDEAGNPAPVVGMSPVFIHRECSRITFNDGTSIVSDDEHPWAVEEREGRKTDGFVWSKQIRRTRELERGKHFIACAAPIAGEESPLPIHPYFLGAWLGDGTTTGTTITSGKRDVAEMRAILEGVGCSLGQNIAADGRAPTFTVLGERAKFGAAGLLGNKHIPDAYLRASHAQRFALLQGLMDTDGSVSAGGQCSFVTTLPKLADGFKELLATLGIKCASSMSVKKRMAANGDVVGEYLPICRFLFTTREPVFRLTRKLARIGHRAEEPRRNKRFGIRSVERVASVPVRCLMVDTPTHLFLVGKSFIPTHNTSKTERYALTPKAPWVAYENVIEGHPEWYSANQKSYSVLVAKPATGPNGETLPLPVRTPPAAVEAGMSEWSASCERNLMAVAGMQQENPEISARVVSGNKYLQRRQGMQDLTHFQYYDNQTLAIMWTGIILLDLIPYYYDTERMQRIIGDDGLPSMVTINEQKPSQADPSVMEVKNNLQVGRYDVVMDTGPGYQTKREESAESMMQLMGTELGKVVVQTGADIVLRNMDFSGAEELADRAVVTNPAGMAKVVEGLPKQAQTIIGAMQQQMQQKDKQIQDMALELKYKGTIEAAKIEAGREKNVRDDATKKFDIRTKSETARDVAEISGAVQLLNTKRESDEEEGAAQKIIDKGTD